jgi:hypothetical protein
LKELVYIKGIYINRDNRILEGQAYYQCASSTRLHNTPLFPSGAVITHYVTQLIKVGTLLSTSDSALAYIKCLIEVTGLHQQCL